MAGVKGKSGRKANERVFRHALLDKLDVLHGDKDRKRIYGIAETLLTMAETGDIQAIREVMDRTEGKPVQSTAFTDTEGNDIPTSISLEINRGQSKD